MSMVRIGARMHLALGLCFRNIEGSYANPSSQNAKHEFGFAGHILTTNFRTTELLV